MKCEDSERKSVLLRKKDTANVKSTDRIIEAASISAEVMPPLPAKNSVMTAMSRGNLPLQGTKQLVRIAISLSLLPGMMRQPVTPTALQPSPMHIVSACFPQLPQQAKQRSRLKASLGSSPKSSASVKSGKNIAIGGSMTDTTLESVPYTPSTSAPRIMSGRKESASLRKLPITEKSEESHSEGLFAPTTVI